MNDDYISNEPVATGWLRTEIKGDKLAGMAYVREARKALGHLRIIHGINDRMSAGEAGGFYKNAFRKEDGTLIEVLSNNGMDTIRITTQQEQEFKSETAEAKPVEAVNIRPSIKPTETMYEAEPKKFEEPVPVKKKEIAMKKEERVACLWEADQEHYSPAVFGYNIKGPLVGENTDVFMGGGITPLTPFPESAHTSTMFMFDKNTMAANGSFALPNAPTQNLEMSWDNITNKFFISDVTANIGVTVFQEFGLYKFGQGDSGTRYMLPTLGENSFQNSYLDSQQSVSKNVVAITGGVGGAYYQIMDTESGVIVNSIPIEFLQTFPMEKVCVAPNGDVITARSWEGPIEIVRHGIIARSYPQPGIPNNTPGNIQIVVCNDNTTLFLFQLDLSNVGSLYKFTQATELWEKVEFDGDFGPSYTELKYLPVYPKLMHDDVSDAVVVVRADSTGAWVFNAVDCLDQELGDFFFPFENPPQEETDSSGGIFNGCFPQMIHDGALVVRYIVGSSSASVTSQRKCIAGLYVIGILRQTKDEEFTEGEE